MIQEVTHQIENSNNWKSELEQLRNIILDCGLNEEFKWKQPCYTFNDKNILILAQFKNYCAISFLKGVFLKDELNLLEAPGENSRTVRMMKFSKEKNSSINSKLIKEYIYEAIEVEKAGLKVDVAKPSEQNIPEELENKFSESEEFRHAFNSLTPGRQRAYLMFFDQAKQSKTKVDRINKYENRILQGKGMNDCICGLSKRMPNCDGSHKQLDN